MSGERPREEEAPRSRRELRRQRQIEAGGLSGLLARRNAPGRRGGTTATKERPRRRPPERPREQEEVPKSRRELRARRDTQRKKKKGGLAEFVVTIIVAFALVFGVVQPFIVQAFRIPSESMLPTLEVKDRVLANKFIYRFTAPDRGDVVVFEDPDGSGETLIKRVVGLGGDEIRMQGGLLLVNGESQEEPYLNAEEPFRGYHGLIIVPEDHVFLMGDNRGNSADSRVFGPVPLDAVEGEAFLRFWPVGKIGGL